MGLMISCAGTCTGMHVRAPLHLVRHAVHVDLDSKRLFSTDTPPYSVNTLLPCFILVFTEKGIFASDVMSALLRSSPLHPGGFLPAWKARGSVCGGCPTGPPHTEPLAFQRVELQAQCVVLQAVRITLCAPISCQAGE